jgi:hypothetical protein
MCQDAQPSLAKKPNILLSKIKANTKAPDEKIIQSRALKR